MSLRMSEDEYMEYQRKHGNVFEPIKKKPKYNNKQIRVDGILFDSKLEADFYSDLKLQMKAGVIKGFCRQPEFVLVEGFGARKPITYRADFIIFHLDGTYQIIDTKGMQTETFKLKHKLFMDKFPGLELKIIK